MRKKTTSRASLLASVFALSAQIVLNPISTFAGAGPQQRGEKIEQSTKGAVIKGKAPVSKEVLKVKLPKAEESTLKNGLRIVLLEDHKAPTFALQMVVMSGGLSDPPDARGTASFTASLLREGTQRRSSKEIAEQVDSLGASLTAGAGFATPTSSVSASGLVENFDQILDIFSDVVLHPSFPKEEVARFKARQLAQLQFYKSVPQLLAYATFYHAVYGDHPASYIVPTAESVQKITPEALAKFHSTFYTPNNAMLAIAGDVTMKEIVSKVEAAFGGWEKGDAPATQVPQTPAPEPAKVILVDRPGSVQTNLLMGCLSIERTDSDYFPLLVMDKIVGGGPAARLFLNLREDKGYTYGAFSSFSSGKYRGLWQANSEVRTPVTDGAMHEFMSELNRIRDERVSDAELTNAKRSIVGSFALSLEQPSQLLSFIIEQKIYGLPADYWDAYPAKVDAVSAEDVQRVARKYVDLSHLQIVAVGDASTIKGPLEKYGKVELYDENGKPVQGDKGK